MALTFRLTGDRELAVYLGRAANGIKPQVISGLTQAGSHLQKEVKGKFGKYQAGWPKLKRASVIAKYRKRALKGVSTRARSFKFAVGADDPLILFGKLQNSIEKELDRGALEVTVYSDNVYAAVHEYGYKQVPARSYMRLTLSEETDNVVNIISSKVAKVIK